MKKASAKEAQIVTFSAPICAPNIVKIGLKFKAQNRCDIAGNGYISDCMILDDTGWKTL